MNIFSNKTVALRQVLESTATDFTAKKQKWNFFLKKIMIPMSILAGTGI